MAFDRIRFSKLGVSKSLLLGFGSVFAVLLVLSCFTFAGVSELDQTAHEAVVAKDVQQHMGEVEIAHLQWVSKVRDVFIDESLTHVDVQTDPTQCLLGQWLQGEGRAAAEAPRKLLARRPGESDEYGLT